MKLLNIIFISLFSTFLIGQTDFEVRVQEILPPTTPRSVVVQMRPVAGADLPTMADEMQDLVVTLQWDNNQTNDLGAIDNNAGYNITKTAGEQIDGPNEYQIFSLSTTFLFPENWPLNSWVDIFSVPVIGGDPTEIIAVDPDGPSTEPRISYFTSGFAFITDVPSVNGAAVLPIKLTSFNANVYQDKSGKLDWTTETEINGSHFEVFRSTDTDNWESIGTVQAVGESYETQTYNLIDKNVGMLRSNATYYYQLKMVDLDGSFEMSDVRSITFNVEGIEILAYPNPTTDLLFVNMIAEKSLGNGVAKVLILDNSGKMLQKDEISVNGITEIDVRNVPSGLFMIRIMYADKVFTHKIVKIQ